MIVNIDSAKAKTIITGKQLVYYDWRGADTLVLSDSAIMQADLVPVLVDRYSSNYSNHSIEYRRAWRLTTHIFYVYVDAITGEDLNYAVQYVIF